MVGFPLSQKPTFSQSETSPITLISPLNIIPFRQRQLEQTSCECEVLNYMYYIILHVTTGRKGFDIWPLSSAPPAILTHSTYISILL